MDRNLRSTILYVGFASTCALIAACGGSSTSTPSTTAPSGSPSTSPSGSPSSNPSSAPTPAYAFPAPQATMLSTNPTVTLTQGAVTLTATFSASTAGSGTIDVNLGFNNGDITPAAPTDTVGTAVIYGSFYNPTTSNLGFGTSTPKVVMTDTSGLPTTSCSLDVYANNNGTGLMWNSVATGTPAGNSVTINAAPLGGSSTLDFSPGQQIIAVSCH